jgi:hypothetical protein
MISSSSSPFLSATVSSFLFVKAATCTLLFNSACSHLLDRSKQVDLDHIEHGFHCLQRPNNLLSGNRKSEHTWTITRFVERMDWLQLRFQRHLLCVLVKQINQIKQVLAFCVLRIHGILFGGLLLVLGEVEDGLTELALLYQSLNDLRSVWLCFAVACKRG